MPVADQKGVGRELRLHLQPGPPNELASTSVHEHGSQLPTYLHAERAKYGVFLLIKVGEHAKKLKRISNLHSQLKKEGKSLPNLIIIDATSKLSASKLKGFFD